MDSEKLTPENNGYAVKGFRFTKRELVLAIIALIGLVLVIVASLLLGLGVNFSQETTFTEKVIKVEECLDAGCFEIGSYMRLLRNESGNPCDNFYQYACTGFPTSVRMLALNEQELTVFHKMREENEERVQSVLSAPSQRNVDWASEVKVKNFYTSCTDTYTRSAGDQFVNQILGPAGGWNAIDTWDESAYDLTTAMKSVHIDFWKDALFQVRIGPDWLDSSKYSLQIGLGGLTLYWWDYTGSNVHTTQLANATKTFMATVAELVMRDSGVVTDASTRQMKAKEFAEDVFEFERKIGNLTWHTLPSEDPHEHENRVAISELNSIANLFDWQDILTSMFTSLTGSSTVVMLEEQFLSELNNLINNLPNQKRTLNNYFTWKLMQGYVSDLGWEYIHANRDFYVARTGLAQFLGIPKACFNYVERHFGDALGALYIRDHLLTEDKALIDNMVTYLKQGLSDRLKAAKWMDDKTRVTAIEKEMEMKEKLGYPNWMIDNDHLDKQYSSLDMKSDDYLGNLISIARYERNLWNDRLVNGENRDDWRFRVYDTSGTYDNFWNELLIPAGLIQFPVYGKNMPHYYNFGSLGANLAHEMTHAVDEIGGYYLKNGTYFDWWSPLTTTQYNKQRTCLENLDVQAGPYKEAPTSTSRTIKIDGTYVARELISETGGVRIGYYAYKDWAKVNQKEKAPPGLNLTIDQTYFLAFAQTQCFVRRDAYSITRAERNIIPEDTRVNLALAHTPEFAKAFNCPVGSPMHAEEICEVF